MAGPFICILAGLFILAAWALLSRFVDNQEDEAFGGGSGLKHDADHVATDGWDYF